MGRKKLKKGRNATRPRKGKKEHQRNHGDHIEGSILGDIAKSDEFEEFSREKSNRKEEGES